MNIHEPNMNINRCNAGEDKVNVKESINTFKRN